MTSAPLAVTHSGLKTASDDDLLQQKLEACLKVDTLEVNYPKDFYINSLTLERIAISINVYVPIFQRGQSFNLFYFVLYPV